MPSRTWRSRATIAVALLTTGCEKCSDNAGPTAPVQTTPTADRTAPAVQITTPQAGASLASDVIISGTASDAGVVTRVEVSLNGGSYRLANGTTTWTMVADVAASGPLSIGVRATDDANNTSVPVTRSATVLPGWRLMAPEIAAPSPYQLGVASIAADATRLMAVWQYRDAGTGSYQGEVVQLTETGWARRARGNDVYLNLSLALDPSGAGWAYAGNNQDMRACFTGSTDLTVGTLDCVSGSLLSHQEPRVAFAFGIPYHTYTANSRYLILGSPIWRGTAFDTLPGSRNTGGIGQMAPSGNVTVAQALFPVNWSRLAGDASGYWALIRESANCLSVERGTRVGGSNRYNWLGPCFRAPSNPLAIVSGEIAVHAGTPYVAWLQGITLYVARWTGSTWTIIGSVPVVVQTSYFLQSTASAIYLMQISPDMTSARVTIDKYVPGTGWASLPPGVETAGATLGFSGGVGEYKGQVVVGLVENSRLRIRRYVP